MITLLNQSAEYGSYKTIHRRISYDPFITFKSHKLYCIVNVSCMYNGDQMHTFSSLLLAGGVEEHEGSISSI